MLRFILADLRRLWLGSLVMVLLLAVAVALGIGVTLQERALRLGSARAADKFDLVIGARGSETQLVLSTVFLQPDALPLVPSETLAALQADPRVAWAAPVGFGDFYQGFPVVGTTTRLITETAPGLSEGRMFQAEGEAVIGAMVTLAPGDLITPTHGDISQGGHAHDDMQYKVTGRLEPTGTPWDRAILVPIQAVWHVHGLTAEPVAEHEHVDGHEHAHDHAHAHAHAHDNDHGHNHENSAFQPDAPLAEDWHGMQTPGSPAILVKPKTIADAYRLRQDYRANESTVGVFPAEVLTNLYGMMGDARRVLGIVAIGAQALVATALLLVTIMHVGQRRQQIASLRALGAPRGSIFMLVWTELFALIACGVALGALGGVVAVQIVSRMIAKAQGFALPVELTAGDIVNLAAIIAGAAIIALFPALIAYRQPAVANLRR